MSSTYNIRNATELPLTDTSSSYLLFQTLLPLFWTLTCMIWMELTRTDAVFSRIAMVLFMCRNKSSRNDLKLHGAYFWKILKILAKESRSGGHTLGTRVGVRPCLVGPLELHRPQLQLHIFVFGGKKSERKIHRVLRTEPPPSPKLSREGWSGVRSGLRRGESVAIIIINLPPSPISWCSPPCVSNSIVGLLDGDGLDEIYHVIELVLLGFDP